MASTIIEAVTQFMQTCPVMEDFRINVDFLPDRILEFSINASPTNPIVKHYVNGSSLRQFAFDLTCNQDYGSDVLQAIGNLGLYEGIQAWLEKQSRLRNFPDLPSGLEAVKIEVTTGGYLFKTSPTMGRYQIQARIIYYQGV